MDMLSLLLDPAQLAMVDTTALNDRLQLFQTTGPQTIEQYRTNVHAVWQDFRGQIRNNQMMEVCASAMGYRNYVALLAAVVDGTISRNPTPEAPQPT